MSEPLELAARAVEAYIVSEVEDDTRAHELTAKELAGIASAAISAGCEPYLKPGQAPSERMAQDQADILGLMKLLEKTKWALQAVDMIADMNTLINDRSGTRSFAGKMVEGAAREVLREDALTELVEMAQAAGDYSKGEADDRQA